MRRKKKLTPQQEKAVLALLTEPNLESAAKAAGVSPQMLKAWKREPAFVQELAKARAELAEIDETRPGRARRPLPLVAWLAPLVVVAGALGAWLLISGGLPGLPGGAEPPPPEPVVAAPPPEPTVEFRGRVMPVSERDALLEREAEEKRAAQERQVDLLRKNADRLFEAGRFVHPPFENAVEAYNRVLDAAPGDPHSTQKLAEIRDHYVSKADVAESHDNAALARMHIERALRAVPTDEMLGVRLERHLADERLRDRKGDHGMVPVPAGPFVMGSEEQGTRSEVDLPGFLIDWTEVTVAAYQRCVRLEKCSSRLVKGKGCNWYKADAYHHPMNCVDYEQAATFCASVDKRLPTEAEWEKAARGTDERPYPWGATRPSCTEAVVSGCSEGTLPVGSRPEGISAFEAVDMAGNLRELVDGWMSDKKKRRVVRGGSYAQGYNRASTTYREGVEPSSRDPYTGFRCARDGTEP